MWALCDHLRDDRPQGFQILGRSLLSFQRLNPWSVSFINKSRTHVVSDNYLWTVCTHAANYNQKHRNGLSLCLHCVPREGWRYFAIYCSTGRLSPEGVPFSGILKKGYRNFACMLDCRNEYVQPSG